MGCRHSDKHCALTKSSSTGQEVSRFHAKVVWPARCMLYMLAFLAAFKFTHVGRHAVVERWMGKIYSLLVQ